MLTLKSLHEKSPLEIWTRGGVVLDQLVLTGNRVTQGQKGDKKFSKQDFCLSSCAECNTGDKSILIVGEGAWESVQRITSVHSFFNERVHEWNIDKHISHSAAQLAWNLFIKKEPRKRCWLEGECDCLHQQPCLAALPNYHPPHSFTHSHNKQKYASKGTHWEGKRETETIWEAKQSTSTEPPTLSVPTLFSCTHGLCISCLLCVLTDTCN